jgi:hypothetical protein
MRAAGRTLGSRLIDCLFEYLMTMSQLQYVSYTGSKRGVTMNDKVEQEMYIQTWLETLNLRYIQWKRSAMRLWRRREDNIKTESGCEDINMIKRFQDRVQRPSFVNIFMNPRDV